MQKDGLSNFGLTLSVNIITPIIGSNDFRFALSFTTSLFRIKKIKLDNFNKDQLLGKLGTDKCVSQSICSAKLSEVLVCLLMLGRRLYSLMLLEKA